MGKNLSNKYSQKHLDSAKKINNRCNKNCSKKSNPKAAEATGDLIDNEIADKSIDILKISSTKVTFSRAALTKQ